MDEQVDRCHMLHRMHCMESPRDIITKGFVVVYVNLIFAKRHSKAYAVKCTWNKNRVSVMLRVCTLYVCSVTSPKSVFGYFPAEKLYFVGGKCPRICQVVYR